MITKNKSTTSKNDLLEKAKKPSKIPIEILKKDEDDFYVNGKPVYKDISGHWIASPSMTTKEVAAFQKYIVDNNLNDTKNV